MELRGGNVPGAILVSCHTHERVMAHTNESRHTHERVMAHKHIPVPRNLTNLDVTHTASKQACACARTHTHAHTHTRTHTRTHTHKYIHTTSMRIAKDAPLSLLREDGNIRQALPYMNDSS